ncbi:MAG: Ribosome-binding factor A [Chlamydiia bacterium]|nr:Ribosome-binding factor A [Chlamydiia bacterium]
MAAPRRIQRVNSLLKEVISDVIRLDLKHYDLPDLITITDVDTSRDLQYAKVYVSLVNGTDPEKQHLIIELQKCASKIAYMASKKVVMRYFPSLTFKIDNTIDEYMKINDILEKVSNDYIDEDEDTEDLNENEGPEDSE